MIRLHLKIAGIVQGVGFRPCVHRLAEELRLAGWVRNSAGGVEIEIEGAASAVEGFPDQLKERIPNHATITGFSRRYLPAENAVGFLIDESVAVDSGAPPTEILPDLATCPECVAEIFDPADRRYGYPFTNCTHCGPRFSIVEGLPYDRPNTTMKAFTMCVLCRSEYESPQNRRFHAQPNACPDCGPQLRWLDDSGSPIAGPEEALEEAALAIERGEIVAVKGIGGFHLFADARNTDAINQLRTRKHRPRKPFAVMAPSLLSVQEQVQVSESEREWLLSSAAPIVILRRKTNSMFSKALAPGNPSLGILLPYSPLHHLLMRRLGFPVVATSGNRGDEPICIDNADAVSRLRGIADGFLVHNRPIARPVDDSVARGMADSRVLLRRSRGFAPVSIPVAGLPVSTLACGGDLKGSLALADGNRVRLSQHFGDLASLESRLVFEWHLKDFPALCRAKPKAIACDRHPGYHSSRLARESHLPTVQVQHHHAHAVACAVENEIDADEAFLGVIWDGTGYGDDGAIWGGEFLRCSGIDFERFAWLRPFPLPGGEKAVRDPRFTAIGCLHRVGIPVSRTPLVESMTLEELHIADRMIEQRVNTPQCSSAGRLFDALSALCDLCRANEFEGQAAMALEFAASRDRSVMGYELDFPVDAEGGEIDWGPLLLAVVDELAEKKSDVAHISLRCHMAFASLITTVVKRAGCSKVALSGGCFQNALLLELTIDRLRSAGFIPIWHREAPPNDGGLALGQAVIASRRLAAQAV